MNIKRSRTLGWRVYVRNIVPTAASAGLDIGLSNMSLLYITISLYTMVKSTSILFLLLFSILLRLESMKWSNVGVIVTVGFGTFLFTFGATDFNAFGFTLVLCASVLGGARWALAQYVMEKKDLELKHPVDTLYHVTPVMFMILLPIALAKEGVDFFSAERIFLNGYEGAFLSGIVIALGAIVAFAMNFSEFLFLSKTSGLTLSICGIIKEIITITLSVVFNDDHISLINIVGLGITVVGILLYNINKYVQNSSNMDVTGVDDEVQGEYSRRDVEYQNVHDQNIEMKDFQIDDCSDDGDFNRN